MPATPTSAAPTPAAPPTPSHTQLVPVDAETEASEDGRKRAHARYMRFWRSVTPPEKGGYASGDKAAPQCVQLETSRLRSTGGKKLRSALTGLWEDWLQSGEQWSEPYCVALYVCIYKLLIDEQRMSQCHMYIICI